MPEVFHRTLGLSVPVTEVLDPAKWKERYAYGIVLGQGDRPAETDSIAALLGCDTKRGKSKTAAGETLKKAQQVLSTVANEIPKDVIRWQLRAALSELEIALGMPMGITIVKGLPVDDGLQQGIDYDKAEARRVFLQRDQANFYRIDLPAGVISVERVRAYWYDQKVWEVGADAGNEEMLQLSHPGTSSLHILPSTSTTLLMAMPALATSAYGALQLISGYPDRLPGVWSVDYTLGPRTKTGEVGQIEAALAHWCYCKAGVVLLSIGGMAASKGLTSASLSIDGLSKSIGLQASAMYGINSALEQRLKEATEALNIDKLRIYKRGLRIRGY